MEDLLNLDMENLELQNGINLEKLRTGSEFELQKEDNFYEITEDPRLNKEEFDQIYNSVLEDEEEISPIDLATASFENIAKNMKDISNDGGILKKLMKRGHGPLITENSIVDVHYNAYFEYSDDPFDSSHLRKETFKYRMGSGRAIPGWEIALLSMNQGEKSRFLFRPDYGFREIGCPPRVPRSATSLFIIEVLNIRNEVGVNDFHLLTEDERQNVTFDQINKLVHSEKTQATSFFDQKKYKQAFNKYKQAAHLLETCRLKSDEEEMEYERLLISLYLNMALCCIRLSHSGRTITYCRKVLHMDRRNTKALFRLGQAYLQLKQFGDAKVYLRQAQRILPNDLSIQKELKRVEEEQAKFKFLETNMYKKMVSGIGEKKEDSTQVSADPEPVKEESDDVSKEFKDSVLKYLQGFEDDKCQDECPMPTNMSESEMEFVVQAVNDLGLYIVQSGSGQHSSIQITRTKENLRDDQILLSDV